MPQSSQSPCDLSAILEIWPGHDHQCAGIAKSTGQRCKLSTNQQNRSIACSLLQEGSALLNAGAQSIDDILAELAPRTLCMRWHQSQANGLVRQWETKVDKFVQQRRAAHARQSRERYYSSRRQSSTEANMGNRSSPHGSYSPTHIHIHQNNVLLNVESLYVFSNTPTPQARSAPATTSPSARPYPPSVATIASNRNTVIQDTPSRVTHTPSRVTHTPSRVTRTPSRMIESRVTPTDEPTEARNTAETRNTQRLLLPPPPRRTNNTTARRPIEGDCGICYLPLVDDDGDDTDSSDDSSVEARSSTNTRPRPEPLVWCKAQCGHNYHKSCMDPWVACCVANSRAATCPTCRATWRP